MPIIPVTIQVFSAVFIGDSEDSSPLTRISDLRTNGVAIKEEKPTVFLQSIGKRVQSGNHVASATLTFVSDSDTVTKISRGIRIADSADDPPGEAVYSLFLLSPNPNTKTSYYFPAVEVVSSFEVKYAKDEVTSLVIVLQAESRDITEDIIYKDTVSALDTIMGTKSPI